MQIKPSITCRLVLKNKYRNQQLYHHVRIINSIIEEKNIRGTIRYVDLQCWIDQDEFMKRPYRADQWKNKMSIFQEYYFYHEDCPRIFEKNIEMMYGKWHDRKRDFVYRKFIKGYGKGADDSESSLNCDPLPSHFLLNISEYNPFSKKYYLRVEARKQQALKQKKDNENHTQSELSNLNHQLSEMLNQIHDLSAISTLAPNKKSKIFRSKFNEPTSSSSQELSSSHQHDYSAARFNFQKVNRKKQLTDERKNSEEKLSIKKKIAIHYHNGTKEKSDLSKPSPSKPLLFHGLESLKTKSIYSVSSLGTLKVKTSSCPKNSQRQFLNLNFDNKNQAKMMIQKKQPYEKFLTEKKSEEKKKTPTKKILSHKKAKASQLSRRKIQTKPNEFCDQRLTKQKQTKPLKQVQIYNSQHASSKKNLFQIKNVRQEFMNKIGAKKQKIVSIQNC